MVVDNQYLSRFETDPATTLLFPSESFPEGDQRVMGMRRTANGLQPGGVENPRNTILARQNWCRLSLIAQAYHRRQQKKS
jgi:hypothetical protein